MSKIPQKAIEAAAKAMCNSWCYAPIGTPDGDQEWKRKQDQYRIQAKAALEAADATRAQGAEVEPGKDIAKQRFELWFFRDILDEHRLKLLTLFGVPTNDQTGQTHGFQKRVLRHIWLSLTAPPAPQPTEREKVLEEAKAAALYVINEHRKTYDLYRSDLQGRGKANAHFWKALVDVCDSIEVGISTALSGKAPTQTDRAEGEIDG